MPKVNIREIDNTGSGQTSFVENIVVVPGIVIGKEADNNLVEGLFEDYDAFDKACIEAGYILVNEIPEEQEVGVTYVTPEDVDTGYLYAKIILQMGLPIVYKGAYVANETRSNDYPTKANFEKDLNGVATKFYKYFEDKGLYDARFVITSGITTPEVIKAALKATGNRADAQALFNTAKEGAVESKLVTREVDGETQFDLVSGDSVKLNTAELVDKWIQYNFQDIANTSITRKAPTWAKDINETYGRYGAFFTPDFITSFTLGEVAFKNYTVSAVLAYLSCFAKYSNTFATWFAMAGSVRGVASLSVTPIKAYGDADIEILEPREAAGENSQIYDPETGTYKDSGNDINFNHVAANVICNIRPYGNLIWGNRTMHPLSAPQNGSSTEIQLVASSFLNIRNLVIDIKKRLYRVSRRFTFDPNSDILWINFKGAIEPLLESMASKQGIRSYEIVKVATHKKALLAARVIITPIEAVEDFDLTIELTDSINVLE